MARLPRGTVTLLYATSAAHQDWADHLRTAVTVHGGQVIHAADGSFQAVFLAPLAALRTVLQAQRHILASAPGGVHTLMPAMAVHTGRVHERNGHYAGPTVNRVLSILAAAHPGQILVSASVHDALNDGLPDEVQLQHLGEYRLKDLWRTAQLYQVVVPGLSAEFPPLHTLDVRPHNLPIQDSPLIGREQEVASTCALLRDPATRLLTLLGASGLGKTRLALQVAVEVIDDFADGVWFVALAPVSDPALLPSIIAQVVGLKEQPGQPLMSTLATFLEAKQLLLVLDNFEQLLAATPLVLELLAAAPQVKILVTSQVALSHDLEHVFAVPPLALPDPTRRLHEDVLGQIPAVALFVERARDVQPTFTLTAAMAPAIIELCVRLEGVPLAIELVASQSTRYFPGDMLIMLQNRLSMARTIRRGNTREDTLRPVLDWICDVLGASVAGLYARLGVFTGGCTAESATAVCNPNNDLALDVEQALDVLLANHLLLREELKEGHVRYTMLDAIHEDAEQRLSRRREVGQFQTLHANYYTTLAETAEPQFKSPQLPIWLARLEDEHHNLRAALKWSLAHQPALALRLSGALWRFWYMRSHYTEGYYWLQVATTQAGDAPPAIQVPVFHGLGAFEYLRNNSAGSRRAFETALALRRELGDKVGVAATLNNLALIAVGTGQHAEAIPIYEESLALSREINDHWGVANTLSNLGQALFRQGDLERAISFYTESAASWEGLGEMSGRAVTLGNLGRALCQLGDSERASAVLAQALSMAQQLNSEWIMAGIFEYQARVSLAQGNLAEARRLITDSIQIQHRLGDLDQLVLALDVLADLLLAEGRLDATAQVMGAAASRRQALGAPPAPMVLSQLRATTTATLAHMSQNAFDAAYQVGAAMPLDELLEQVLAPGP